MDNIKKWTMELGSPDLETRRGAASILQYAAGVGLDMTAAMSALAKALCDESRDVRMEVAEILGNAANKGADMTVAMGALAKTLSDGNVNVRKNAAWALGEAIGKCPSIEALGGVEADLRREYGASRKRCQHQKKDESAGIELAFSRLMNEAVKRRDALAPQRDIMLDGMPRPPKSGKMYQKMRRVRNG